MGKIILKVKKKHRREGDHIAYFVYEMYDESIYAGGTTVNCRHVENYERLMFTDEKAQGQTNLFYLEENENEVFFEIKEAQIPMIKTTAIELTGEFPGNYSLQYAEFLRRLSAQGIIGR
ncbi:hypothetical protein [Planococcus sp. YIM B11945]|uniref:hypothetical protein n=1 Tax=Planococcus sp. YIM B11945 TaxID=3435410 RepID=UPI003D7CDB67